MEHVHVARWMWLIPVFPLIGAFVNGVFGLKIHRKYGESPIHTIAVLMPTLSFFVTLWLFFGLMGSPAEDRRFVCHLYDWIRIGGFSVPHSTGCGR